MIKNDTVFIFYLFYLHRSYIVEQHNPIRKVLVYRNIYSRLHFNGFYCKQTMNNSVTGHPRKYLISSLRQPCDERRAAAMKSHFLATLKCALEMKLDSTRQITCMLRLDV